MNKVINKTLLEVIQHNQLECLDVNLFRGYASKESKIRIYGGQVMAQAIRAAQLSVEKKYSLHSFHGYFLRPGDPSLPVIYEVDPIRDGRSFFTRRVVAKQRGLAIFNCSMSFQVWEEGFDHQAEMPVVAPPEQLCSEEQLYKKIDPNSQYDFPIEFRCVDPMDYANPVPKKPSTCAWFRVPDRIDDDPCLHQQLLAYASDLSILSIALWPHGVTYRTPNVMMATIDHSLWIHRPFRVDEWLLYDLNSDSASGGRGIGRGRIFTRCGDLVASVVQEGLIRLKR